MSDMVSAIICLARAFSPETWEKYPKWYHGSVRQIEMFAKDIFSDSLGLPRDAEAATTGAHDRTFSFTGERNNPPDFIIRGGDAVEVKRTGAAATVIQLNSSPPRQVLRSDSPYITQQCRDCEGHGGWKEKDLVYFVAQFNDALPKKFWFIQGACYAAPNDVYEGLKDDIRSQLGNNARNTNELAQIKNVDPRDATNLRVRPIWAIKHPSKYYQDHVEIGDGFGAIAILKPDKFEKIKSQSRGSLEDIASSLSLTIEDREIQSPDDSSKTISVKIICFGSMSVRS